MKTIKRMTVLGGTVALAGVLFSPSASAAPLGTPYYGTQVGGAGGGDHGLGNCGYNHGGGKANAQPGPTGSPTPGLGGYAKTTCPVTSTVTAPTVVQQESVSQPVQDAPVQSSEMTLTIDDLVFI